MRLGNRRDSKMSSLQLRIGKGFGSADLALAEDRLAQSASKGNEKKKVHFGTDNRTDLFRKRDLSRLDAHALIKEAENNELEVKVDIGDVSFLMNKL